MNSPFFLVYEKEVILPPNIFLPYLKLSQRVQGVMYFVMQNMINALMKLGEERE